MSYKSEDFQRLTAIIEAEPGEQPQETPAETGSTEAAPAEGNDKESHCGDDCAEHDTHSEGDGNSHPNPDEGGKGEQPDDKSAIVDNDKQKHSKEEQQKFAFAKLTKKNSELRKQIAALQAKNKEYEEKLSKPLKAEDFKNQADFYSASTEQLLDARDMKHNKEQLDSRMQELMESEAQEAQLRAEENIRQLFPSEEAQNDYRKVVGTAVEKGFDKFLDNTPQGQSIVDFCNASPIGAKIIYHLAKNPKDFVTLMKSPTPQVQSSRLVALEQQLTAGAQQTQAQTQVQETASPDSKKRSLPHSGKLKTSAPAGDVDDDEAIAMIRRRL